MDLARVMDKFSQLFCALQVNGIVSHPDFEVLLAGAALDGMVCTLAAVHSSSRVTPMYRDRWLATFVHSSVDLAPSVVQEAAAISLVSVVLPAPGPTLAQADSVHPPESTADRIRLCLSPDAFELMQKSDMIPAWMKTKVNWTVPDPVLKARTITCDMKMCSMMARYGSQYLLPEEHLRGKGLQTMLYQDGDVLRYFCPWEILSTLAFPPTVVIAFDFQMAFQ